MAFGVKDQLEFTEKVLEDNNPLGVDGKEYDLVIFGNGPYPWDEDDGVKADWLPTHKWGPSPAWALLCWKEGERAPYDSTTHVQPLGEYVKLHLLQLRQMKTQSRRTSSIVHNMNDEGAEEDDDDAADESGGKEDDEENAEEENAEAEADDTLIIVAPTH
jgi:hypothetical protein